MGTEKVFWSNFPCGENGSPSSTPEPLISHQRFSAKSLSPPLLRGVLFPNPPFYPTDCIGYSKRLLQAELDSSLLLRSGVVRRPENRLVIVYP